MTTHNQPEPSDADIAEFDAEPADQILEDVDRIVRGDLPFGALFGLDADDIHAFADLADDLLAAGRVADAQMLYEGCVQLDPMDVTLLCGYATCLRHAGDNARCRQVVALIGEAAPGDPDVLTFLSETHLDAV